MRTRQRGEFALTRLDLEPEQERFRTHDPNLQTALDATYEYMTKHLDPVLSKAIEEVLLYQPDQTADFLAQFLRGTLNPKKFTYVVR